jgi:hypothetical protein
MASRIPVFVSAPSALSADQQLSYDRLIHLLEKENLERRALGRSDYPSDFPLKEVHTIARHCAGGLILGYTQSLAPTLQIKPGIPIEPGDEARRNPKDVKFPTPWNQLEAGILFSLRLPLMVLREKGVSGGIFDIGTTDIFVNDLPVGRMKKDDEKQLIFSLQIWAGRVREHYRKWE